VFDLRGCTTLKIGKLLGQLLVVLNIGFNLAIGTPRTDPWSIGKPQRKLCRWIWDQEPCESSCNFV